MGKCNFPLYIIKPFYSCYLMHLLGNRNFNFWLLFFIRIYELNVCLCTWYYLYLKEKKI